MGRQRRRGGGPCSSSSSFWSRHSVAYGWEAITRRASSEQPRRIHAGRQMMHKGRGHHPNSPPQLSSSEGPCCSFRPRSSRRKEKSSHWNSLLCLRLLCWLARSSSFSTRRRSTTTAPFPLPIRRLSDCLTPACLPGRLPGCRVGLKGGCRLSVVVVLLVASCWARSTRMARAGLPRPRLPRGAGSPRPPRPRAPRGGGR